MRLTGKDLAATVSTGAAVAVYVAFLQGTDLPLITSVRGTAAVVLLLGWVGGCAMSGVGDAYLPGRKSPFMVALLTVLGGVAFAAAVIALVTASELALAVLVVATVLLWFLATLRHLFQAPVRTQEHPSDEAVGGRRPARV